MKRTHIVALAIGLAHLNSAHADVGAVNSKILDQILAKLRAALTWSSPALGAPVIANPQTPVKIDPKPPVIVDPPPPVVVDPPPPVKPPVVDPPPPQPLKRLSFARPIALLTYDFGGGFPGPNGPIGQHVELAINFAKRSFKVVNLSDPSQYENTQIQRPCFVEFSGWQFDQLKAALARLELVVQDSNYALCPIDAATSRLSVTDRQGDETPYVLEGSSGTVCAGTSPKLINGADLVNVMRSVIELSCPVN